MYTGKIIDLLNDIPKITESINQQVSVLIRVNGSLQSLKDNQNSQISKISSIIEKIDEILNSPTMISSRVVLKNDQSPRTASVGLVASARAGLLTSRTRSNRRCSIYGDRRLRNLSGTSANHPRRNAEAIATSRASGNKNDLRLCRLKRF